MLTSSSTGGSSAGRTGPQSVADPGHWLAGRVAVVTGASRGIGAATAEALAGAGAHVVLAARDGDALASVAGGIQAGRRRRPRRCPPTSARPARSSGCLPPPRRPAVSAALVCAAAVLTSVPFGETTLDIWEETLGVNLTGSFLCCRAAFTAMRAAGEGRIVNIASLSGVYATEKFPGLAAYNVSKYGVIGLTEAIAVEGRPHGISAICVSPGAVDTQMLRRANPELRPGLTPGDVAELILALLDSPLAPASGANIPLFSNA